MKSQARRFALIFALVLVLLPVTIFAQEKAVVLTGAQLTRVVPLGFYFEGQSAPTQPRNAAAARFGEKRHVVAALVDTSGYATEIRAKYEGFFIADSPSRVGDRALETGDYGFGFTDDGRLNIFDVGGRQVLSVAAETDKNLRRPRPLMMQTAADGLRFYAGRTYIVIN